MVDAKELKGKVEVAKSSVEGLEEPFRTEAFKIILSKLLNKTPEDIGAKKTESAIRQKPVLTQAENSDKKIPKLNRSKYPEIYKLETALDKSLFILKAYKNEYNIDGLNPPQIANILTEVFRIKTKKETVSMALMKAYKETDKIKGEGKSFIYKIMDVGEKLLEEKL